MVDSSGNVVEYVYDKVGNMLEIKRSTAAGLAIFNFTPKRGPVGAKVTIQGQGFSANPTDNIVRFNGTSAGVLSATATTLSVTVPVGATTSPISVQVSAKTATSSQNFTVTKAPVITSVSPPAVVFGTTVTNFQVTGSNLSGSTFAFVPAFVPAAITINAAAIDPSGTSPTLSLTIGAQAGQFVLVATNADGSSDAIPTTINTVYTFDPQSGYVVTDDDGDGFPNQLEVLLGSDPFDRNSVPNPDAFITETAGPIFSLVNNENPTGGTLPNEAIGVTASVLNTENPTGGTLPNEVVGATNSVLNTENPTGGTLPNEAVGPTFSIRNQ